MMKGGCGKRGRLHGGRASGLNGSEEGRAMRRAGGGGDEDGGDVPVLRSTTMGKSKVVTGSHFGIFAQPARH